MCASCHAQRDELGFALENFDAIGEWRDGDAAGSPIDPAAKLLSVVGWTARRKGLPYVCPLATPPDVVAALREAVTAAGMAASG